MLMLLGLPHQMGFVLIPSLSLSSEILAMVYVDKYVY